ncbi:hypothetical protein F4780DRAFT_159996 [Xylariomycetidae sp. FL0641]|nr:hypothetical protein F4780DRAFT_159996 [Xylariomycetidae sp. FL0641]
MVARRALAAAGCSHCRAAVLNLFASTLRPVPLTQSIRYANRSRAVLNSSLQLASNFSSSNSPPSDPNTDQEVQHGQKHGPVAGEVTKEGEVEVEEEEEQDATKEESNRESAPVPWYLQVEPPRHVAAFELPPLPEVPEGSPSLIDPLIKYAAEEMGLDDLDLLDLRQMDPPPALGPNLFMLFGTARSERHLNVSAGRLVRWLRAKHQVYADADGLLGPNERKLKLRRKARKAKLLGTMGTDDADDGIRTGWICVNLGIVGRGGPESAVIAEDGRVAGFGVARRGSTIVVQVMTESRRAEMDLERIWRAALKRSIKENAELQARSGDDPQARSEDDSQAGSGNDAEEPLHPVEKAMLLKPGAGRRDRSQGSRPRAQARFYSTQRTLESTAVPEAPLGESLEHALVYDADRKRNLLGLLRRHIDDLPPSNTLQTLGQTSTGQELTPFLRLFHLTAKGLAPQHTWGDRLAVQTKAREVGHLGALQTSYDDIRLLLEEMRIDGLHATREQYLQLLFGIYSGSSAGLAERSRLASKLLETMQQRGQSIIDNDVIVTIIDAVSRPRSNAIVVAFIERLRDLMKCAELPYMGEALVMRLMSAYARRYDWKELMNVWRIPPRHLHSRSARMYEHIYNLATSSGSRDICTTILRRLYQEMLSEQPAVQPVGAVREALLRCIHVADPRAEQHADLSTVAEGQNALLGRREFVKMVRDIKHTL